MLTARDIMTREVVAISEDMEITAAARLLLEKGFNGAPVVDATGRLTGILCQSDLVAQQKRLTLPSVFSLLDGFVSLGSTSELDREMQKISALTVKQAMTADPATVGPDTPLEDVATLMVERAYHTLPVVESSGLIGVIGLRDVLKTLTGTA